METCGEQVGTGLKLWSWGSSETSGVLGNQVYLGTSVDVG